MASLKYRQFIIDEDSLEWKISKRFTFPLLVLRILLILVPESILRNFFEDDFGTLEGITFKQLFWIIYQILKETAEFKQANQNQVVYENRKENLKYIILVE